mmetsp:Transcript_58102/g.138227  ORF Transcript_58102/g.138227 Transcript_58102/m.138227 type:complete len:778 (+) Transcript_58102:75-2408(+)|eukprot:CAMPEP_0178404152 /NCGR_PEP_ID=MMETSP0689_2-20121128/17733_1 /TAXON_ID=160604 /ORGANISM="Amphidinium massartii, Strain CS-259" /LENGTH=777 /DNA_ID=CAMNT_0020025121 /DNA_START=10 /DNA_END=2343 /DNA_ORIENTATION=-
MDSQEAGPDHEAVQHDFVWLLESIADFGSSSGGPDNGSDLPEASRSSAGVALLEPPALAKVLVAEAISFDSDGHTAAVFFTDRDGYLRGVRGAPHEEPRPLFEAVSGLARQRAAAASEMAAAEAAEVAASAQRVAAAFSASPRSSTVRGRSGTLLKPPAELEMLPRDSIPKTRRPHPLVTLHMPLTQEDPPAVPQGKVRQEVSIQSPRVPPEGAAVDGPWDRVSWAKHGEEWKQSVSQAEAYSILERTAAAEGRMQVTCGPGDMLYLAMPGVTEAADGRRKSTATPPPATVTLLSPQASCPTSPRTPAASTPGLSRLSMAYSQTPASPTAGKAHRRNRDLLGRSMAGDAAHVPQWRLTLRTGQRMVLTEQEVAKRFLYMERGQPPRWPTSSRLLQVNYQAELAAHLAGDGAGQLVCKVYHYDALKAEPDIDFHGIFVGDHDMNCRIRDNMLKRLADQNLMSSIPLYISKMLETKLGFEIHAGDFEFVKFRGQLWLTDVRNLLLRRSSKRGAKATTGSATTAGPGPAAALLRRYESEENLQKVEVPPDVGELCQRMLEKMALYHHNFKVPFGVDEFLRQTEDTSAPSVPILTGTNVDKVSRWFETAPVDGKGGVRPKTARSQSHRRDGDVELPPRPSSSLELGPGQTCWLRSVTPGARLRNCPPPSTALRKLTLEYGGDDQRRPSSSRSHTSSARLQKPAAVHLQSPRDVSGSAVRPEGKTLDMLGPPSCRVARRSAPSKARPPKLSARLVQVPPGFSVKKVIGKQQKLKDTGTLGQP